MTEDTEKNVSMKCTRCGYIEDVPDWVLDELALGRRGNGYEMCCPRCDGRMVEKQNVKK